MVPALFERWAPAIGRPVRVRVESAISPLWNAAGEFVEVEAGDRRLLDDPRASSFRG
jgi:hypothetical protein